MSARRLSLNENDRSKCSGRQTADADADADMPDRDDLDKVYAAHKDEQLQHTREGKARWRQELASSSESAVRQRPRVAPRLQAD